MEKLIKPLVYNAYVSALRYFGSLGARRPFSSERKPHRARPRSVHEREKKMGVGKSTIEA
jgi:hypothetical protein